MLNVTAPSLPVVSPLMVFTTPLYTLVSSPSLNHRIYADDTQLFLCFCLTPAVTSRMLCKLYPPGWLPAYWLFNTSKTEFLLFGLKQQLAEINSWSLDTVHSARNLGFIACCGLPISHYWTFISKCYGWDSMGEYRLEIAIFEGLWVSLIQNYW